MDLSELLNEKRSRIVLLVADGLGGFRDAEHDTELAEANTPNLDALAAEGSTGLLDPLSHGLTVGSGPGHLALFGYDPQKYDLGRGILSALGVGFPLQPGDVASRGNLAVIDDAGNVTDRRAGRIPDDQAQKLVDRLTEEIDIDGVEVFFRHIAEHRVLVVLRGEGLDPRLADIDPQETGVPPRKPRAKHPDAEKSAEILGRLDAAMRDVLQGERGNALLLRGFDTVHELPQMQEMFGVNPATVAIYPMYRGVAQLVGMEVLPKPKGLEGQIAAMRDDWDAYDYWFMHFKKTDAAGHDGDRPAKVAAIEELDAAIPALRELNPDVLVVTGDHSSPTQVSAHSWHPVPVLMWGKRVGVDDTTVFNEHAAVTGGLGRRPTMNLMPEMLAAAGRLEKYGA